MAIAEIRREQKAILAQLQIDLDKLPPGDPARARKVRLLAALEKRINDVDLSYPRRRYMSPSSVREPYTAYYRALEHRIEEQGTRDFPKSQGRPLYGDVVLNLTIDALGRIVETELVHGSGNALLDRKSTDIARSAAPFGTFSEAMLEKADQIVVTSRFHFAYVPGTEATSSAGSGDAAVLH